MCGIFGFVSKDRVSKEDISYLVKHSEQRGSDSSGLVYFKDRYNVFKADFAVTKLLNETFDSSSKVVFGHSRLITNGLADNQPVILDDIAVFHNGIIVNDAELFEEFGIERRSEIDSEIIVALVKHYREQNVSYEDVGEKILAKCKGVVSCAILISSVGKLLLFSNNGSLYVGEKEGDFVFASESFPLRTLQCKDIEQVYDAKIIDIPNSVEPYAVKDFPMKRVNVVPKLGTSKTEEALLEFPTHDLKRCTKCILPETMPYIKFDNEGVCNYCANYKIRNKPKPLSEFLSIVEPYRRAKGNEVIVPFSGGRDSCYGLHLIVKELDLKPVTYTYDWGMVTDLGRRNISRMCAELGVENIIVAADIELKRRNIAMNLKAWLKNPNLGMVSILTAGDKHFFRYVEQIKEQTSIDLNLWGVNPLEVTHFKAGFLGVPPDFAEEKVYSNGAMKQLNYQFLRLKAMMKSPSYFNSSLWDTLSGEYYRSFKEKKDYFHIFDYWKWDEEEIDDVLLNTYEWEKATDTPTTWRIGDGTAALYNYIYYTIAGFTEHDTFRSNQIREGQMTRELALELVHKDNAPRYPNIKWYLDALNMDYGSVIKTINNIPKLY